MTMDLSDDDIMLYASVCDLAEHYIKTGQTKSHPNTMRDYADVDVATVRSRAEQIKKKHKSEIEAAEKFLKR